MEVRQKPKRDNVSAIIPTNPCPSTIIMPSYPLFKLIIRLDEGYEGIVMVLVQRLIWYNCITEREEKAVHLSIFIYINAIKTIQTDTLKLSYFLLLTARRHTLFISKSKKKHPRASSSCSRISSCKCWFIFHSLHGSQQNQIIWFWPYRLAAIMP